jgi:hypothetical protein
MRFNDDSLFDGGDDADELESPGRVSDQQQQTPRRPNRSNVVQDDDDEDLPNTRSKGKAKAMNGNHDEEENEDEIAQGLEDVDMREDDENDEVAPKTKPKEKRPRNKRASVEMPCKSSLLPRRKCRELISEQYLRKILLASEEASEYATSHSSGGGVRKLSTADVTRARKPMSRLSKRLCASPKIPPSH